jgi:8-oxo-dGTP pyrophosphatase MutT (NUDIX family)
MNLDRLTSAEIGEILHTETPPTWDIPVHADDAGREAGVLMPLLRKEGAWHLLYIRRPESEQDDHSGQVAFAGGKREQGDDDLLQTALREAREEIGIEPGDVNVLGSLGKHHSVTRFCIMPVVGVIPSRSGIMLLKGMPNLSRSRSIDAMQVNCCGEQRHA